MGENYILGESVPIREDELRKMVLRAYSYAADDDPASSMNNARRAAELICRHLIEEYRLVKEPDTVRELDKMLGILRKHPDALPSLCAMHASTLQLWGNFGSHANGELTTRDIWSALVALHELTDWFCKKYNLALIPWADGGKGTGAAHPCVDTPAFFSGIYDDPASIECICMAQHAGPEWRSSTAKVELINFIKRNRIPLQVIINDPDTARMICAHMKQEGKLYLGLEDAYEKCAEEWLRLQAENPEFIQVHISRIPLMHRIYIIRYKNHTGIANIKYYTHGNYFSEKNPRVYFDSTCPEYNLYNSEFNYLWAN